MTVFRNLRMHQADALGKTMCLSAMLRSISRHLLITRTSYYALVFLAGDPHLVDTLTDGLTFLDEKPSDFARFLGVKVFILWPHNPSVTTNRPHHGFGSATSLCFSDSRIGLRRTTEKTRFSAASSS